MKPIDGNLGQNSGGEILSGISVHQTFSFRDYELVKKFNQVVPRGERSALIEIFISDYLKKKKATKPSSSVAKKRSNTKPVKLGVELL